MGSRSKPSVRMWLMFASLSVLLAVTVVAIWFVVKGRLKSKPAGMAKAIELNNRGIGLMEMYKYPEAAETFGQARDAAPEWQVPQINYGIARMNMAHPPDLEAAIAVFESVLRADPDNPHAHFCLGMIIKYRNRLDEATQHFEKVVQIDERDAGAWFHLADCLFQTRQDDERSLQCIEKAYKYNPYLRGPIYQLQARLQATDPERAAKLLDEFKKLDEAEVIDDLAIRYTCMGSKYAEVIGKPAGSEASPPPVFRPAANFSVRLAAGSKWATANDFGSGETADTRRSMRQRYGATIIRLDFNRDDKIDLLLLGAVVENGQVRDLLLKNEGDGQFTDVTATAGLAGARASLGCCAGDFDNDGKTDLFITGVGTQKLLRNKGDGSFEDVTAQAGFDKLTSVCAACTWIDLEQDGDLDLVVGETAGTIRAFLNTGVAGPARNELGDPMLTVRFAPFTEFNEVTKSIGPVVALAVTDADCDRDLDIVVFGKNKRPMLVLNDRLLRFHLSDLNAIKDQSAFRGALVLDGDQDERSELLVLAEEKTTLLRNRRLAGEAAAECYEAGATNSPPLRQAQAADVDLDGWTDVVGLSQDGKPVFLANDRQGKLEHRPELFGADQSSSASIAIAFGDFTGDSNPDLLTWSEPSGLSLLQSSGNGNQCLKIVLDGRRLKQKRPQLRTNQDGFGARIGVQAGPLWTGIEATTLSAGLGQSSAPVELGIGKAKSAEAVRLRWPDLVVQAEIDFEGGRVHRIRQVGRKPDSCPVIFTFNGEKFVYVTDCLGAGSMGEMLAGGGTRRPRSEESVKIDGKHLQLHDGWYLVKIAEPMDEIMYLDRVQLVVVDHPNDVQVFPDERFAIADPPPSQELLYFKDRWFPRAARTSSGHDVTATVRAWDRLTVDDFRSMIWLGVAEEHWLELEFSQQLARIGPNDRIALCLAGWTEYAYPHTIFGLVQAGTPPVAPVLERQDPDGTWRSVAELGFPAGEPRMITADVTGKLAGHEGKLRIRTNMQVYWDQIFLAPLVVSKELKPQITELDLAHAKLSYHGFCREYSPDGRRPPLYDYDQLENIAVSSWSGWLTKFGDVTELLQKTDDRFVIGGPGDEVSLQFDGSRLPPLPTGWKRSFVLRTWGYCKDNAPFTATAGFVQPMPFRAMKQYPPGPGEKYPHADDMRRWHTRRIGAK